MAQEQYIIAIDQSTQGTKCILFDSKGQLVARTDASHKQHINDKGWVEHDPEEIAKNLKIIAQAVLDKAKIDANNILAAAITNQRETCMAWDKATGKPVYNAIVWQCARAEAICEAIRQTGCGEKIQQKTGLPLSPYFSASKLKWIMDNVPAARELAAKDQLCCGTMDSWVVYNLTSGKSFKTDGSNACRTQLFNIHTLSWDKELCDIFTIPVNALPEVTDSNGDYGTTDFFGVLPKAVPICAVMGDSHAALFGQGCIAPGTMKSTYGTGSSVMFQTGDDLITSKNGLVTSLAWLDKGKPQYVLEGNINYTGAVITWLKDSLKLIESPMETEALARGANPGDRTYFVPAFTGLGAPYWDSNARGMVTGMSRVTGKNEFVRAALDSIVYQISDIALLMAQESGHALKSLRVDGGPTKNKYLMEFQSNILQLPVEVAAIEEISAAGAAYMAGIAAGLYEPALLQQMHRTTFQPDMAQDLRDELYAGWKAAIHQVQQTR